jgi:hypothetical protein
MKVFKSNKKPKLDLKDGPQCITCKHYKQNVDSHLDYLGNGDAGGIIDHACARHGTAEDPVQGGLMHIAIRRCYHERGVCANEFTCGWQAIFWEPKED